MRRQAGRTPGILSLLSLLALLVLGCAHRLPVDAGGDREAIAGLPLLLGADRALPEGTRVRWDFGDGRTAEGAQVSHAWARAGEYRLRVEVLDPAGARVDEARVRVARRPPAAAVPATATSALVLDRFFSRLPVWLALAGRLADPAEARELAATLRGALGFDPADPEALIAAGLDPDEGLALFSLPGDPGTWAAVGILDEEAARASATRALARSEESCLVAAHGGYLYLRLGPGEADFAPVAGADPRGLFAEPSFARARAALAGQDLFAFGRAAPWLRRAAGLIPGLEGDLQALSRRATTLALALGASPTELALEVRLGFDAAAALAEALPDAPGDLAARAPAGAVGYLALGNAALAGRLLAGWPELAVQLERRLGAPLSRLAGPAPLALAAYLEPAALARGERADALRLLALAGGEGARPRGHPALLAAASADGPRLAGELAAVLPAGAPRAVLWLDVARAVDALRTPPPASDALDAARAQRLALVMAVLFEESEQLRHLAPIRNLLLEAGRDGAELSLRGRLRLR